MLNKLKIFGTKGILQACGKGTDRDDFELQWRDRTNFRRGDEIKEATKNK
jgi:hypothetical protein